jgi:hypothetical protein
VETRTRCKNMKEQGGLRFPARCHRDATGDDGLCNICRAAIERGKRKQEENIRERRIADQRRYDLARQRSRDERVGEWLRQNDPEKYQAILDGANSGANTRDGE